MPDDNNQNYMDAVTGAIDKLTGTEDANAGPTDDNAGANPTGGSAEGADPADGGAQDTKNNNSGGEPAGGDSPIPDEVIKKSEGADEEERKREEEAQKLTEGLSQKAADKFKAIHQRAWEAEQKAKRLAQVEQQLQEAKKSAPTDELTKLRQRVQELDDIVNKTALTDHPEFKAKYDNKINAFLSQAKSLVGAERQSAVERVLNMPDSEQRNALLEQLTDGMSTFKITRINQLVSAVDELMYSREQEVANFRENKSKYLEQSRSSPNQNTDELIKLTDSVITNLTHPTKGVDVFMHVDGKEDWNRGVDERVQKARELATNTELPPEQRIEVAVNAVAGETYKGLFYHYYKQATSLKSELDKIKNASPNLSRTGATTPSGDIKDKDDFITAVEKATRESGLLG